MRKLIRKCDRPLLLITLFFSVVGLIMVFSSSSIISSFSEKVSPYHYFYRQAIFVFVGYIFGFVIMKIKLDGYNKYIKAGLLGTLILLIGLFFLVEPINGAKSWYDLRLFNLQPSEIAKIFIIFYLAYFFNKYQKNNNQIKNKKFIYPLIVCAIITGLVFLQPDFGTGIIMTALVGIIYFFVPLEKTNKNLIFKLTAFLVVVIASLIIFKVDIITDSQKDRLNYRQPCTRYEIQTGYQLCNSFIAINNGGLFGVGLGNSTQKYLYLPAAHTDFIFAIITEEIGSFGGIIIIAAYIFMLYRIYLISKRADNIRDSIIAFGVMIIFTLHIIINLSGIMGIMPLTGVPLPLLSYGGSFTISSYIMLFMVQRVSIETNQKRLKKEIKAI